MSVSCVVLMALVLASCSSGGRREGEVAPSPVKEIRRDYHQGPLAVRLVADREAISIAESVVLTIEAEAEEGYDIELPRFGAKLDQFGIRDYREDQPQLTPEGKIVARRVYTLEPFLSGDYTVAPMMVRFHKKTEGAAARPAPRGAGGSGDSIGTGSGGSSDASGGAGDHEISTEEMIIKVNSLLDKDQQDLRLNPIKGPVGLPAEPISRLLLALGLGGAVLVAGGIFFWVKKKRAVKGQTVAPAMAAHELAYRQFEEIFAEKLLERGEYKLFFAKISDVLRGYIENRFGLHAPKRTTEEFLTDISRDAPFAVDYRGLLAEFLRNCDLVKFAEHHPSAEEVGRAVDSSKAFIEATKVE